MTGQARRMTDLPASEKRRNPAIDTMGAGQGEIRQRARRLFAFQMEIPRFERQRRKIRSLPDTLRSLRTTGCQLCVPVELC